jgi:diguanylate cyclase (GGDEF)-like protein
MTLLMPTKKTPTSTTRQGALPAIQSQIARLTKQNAVLRREVARLQIYRAMAYRDPLTGLWNRRYFEERLKEEFSRSRRAGGERRFSVLVIDINGFKQINDEHGHQVGDVLLKWVGDFLIAHLRTHDVPCRTGGDEFIVLMPDLSATDCRPVITRLRKQLASVNTTRAIPVSLSIGSASWPEVAESCEKILAVADAAMYADKRQQQKAEGRGAQAGRLTSFTKTGRTRIASAG